MQSTRFIDNNSPQFVIVAMYATPVPTMQMQQSFSPRNHNRMISEFVNNSSALSPYHEVRMPIFAPILALSDRIAQIINIIAAGKMVTISRDNGEAILNAEEGAGISFTQLRTRDPHYSSKIGRKID